MTIATFDQPSPTRLRPRTSPAGQPARGPASSRGPRARPGRLAPLPPSRLVDRAVRGCRPDAGSPPSASWRLTDRGIALVLVLTAVLVVAAVTVIGFTAWRVTGPEYQTTGVSELSSR
jgi:hypothetical protein